MGLGIFFMKLLRLQMALASTKTSVCSRIITKGSRQRNLAMHCELPLHAGIQWRCAGFHRIPESGTVSAGDVPVSIGYQNPAQVGDSCVVSSLSAPVSIGGALVSIGYHDLARHPLETCRYPLGTRIWSGIHWRCAGIHWVLEYGGVSIGDALLSIGYRNLARAVEYR